MLLPSPDPWGDGDPGLGSYTQLGAADLLCATGLLLGIIPAVLAVPAESHPPVSLQPAWSIIPSPSCSLFCPGLTDEMSQQPKSSPQLYDFGF